MPATAPVLDHVAVAARLRIAMARMVRLVRRDAGDELTAGGAAVLAHLERDGSLTPGELAERERMSRPSMSVLTAGLRDAGLVTKVAAGEDRRSVRITLTAAGRAALDRTRRRRTAFLARRLRDLPAADIEVLDRAAAILDRLYEHPA